MYTQFFGLSAKPFELLPNPQFLYLSKGHRKALSYMQYGVQEHSGFILLTGEVGSGKTTIIRDILTKISRDTTLAMIFNTRVDSHQLLTMINEDFGLNAEGKDKPQLLRELNSFLLEECAAGRQPIIIIDEAQNLSLDSLEEVRLLSNLEAENFKMVQIILVGQPELRQMIGQPALRQLRQRISLSCHLGPLNREETEEYIYHRLLTVGNRNCVSFQDGCITRIFDFSGGIPRLINVICDHLLLSAFVHQTRHVSLEQVRDAVEELSFEEYDTSEMVDNSSPILSPPNEDRRHQIEQNYLNLNSGYAEKETILERLSSQGNILQYQINQQQKLFVKLDDISAQIKHLQQLIRDGDQSNGVPENLLIENRTNDRSL